MWDVDVTDEFVQWWFGLTEEQREVVTDRVGVLTERGPDLGRPIGMSGLSRLLMICLMSICGKLKVKV